MLLVDLTSDDEEISQENFTKLYKRSMYGEDAQIMRRYLELRMPFTRGPIPREPIFSVDADEMRSIHSRFNQSYYQKNAVDDVTESDESEIQIEESDDSTQQENYLYKQGADVVDEFFGSPSITPTPILKIPCKRSIKEELAEELHRKRRATLRTKQPGDYFTGIRRRDSKL